MIDITFGYVAILVSRTAWLHRFDIYSTNLNTALKNNVTLLGRKNDPRETEKSRGITYSKTNAKTTILLC